MIRQYEKQPIENAKVYVFDDNGAESLVIEPYEGYRLREKSDDTYSTTQIGIPMQFASLLQNYTAVPIEDENSKKSPTDEAEQNTSL